MSNQKFMQCMTQIWINEGVIDGKTGDYTEDETTTRFGIAYEFNKEFLAHFGIDSANKMDLLSQEMASQIYFVKYWLPCGADLLPNGCDYVLFDAAVNQGVGYASRMVQECINIFFGLKLLKVDGQIGEKTKTAMKNIHKTSIFKEIMCLHRKMAYYQSLTRYARERRELFDKKSFDFEKSWLRRLR